MKKDGEDEDDEEDEKDEEDEQDEQDEEDEEALALAGIEELENFFWGLGLPASLQESGLDITEEALRTMSVGCSRKGTRSIGAGGMKALAEKDMEAIYRASAGK